MFVLKNFSKSALSSLQIVAGKTVVGFNLFQHSKTDVFQCILEEKKLEVTKEKRTQDTVIMHIFFLKIQSQNMVSSYKQKKLNKPNPNQTNKTVINKYNL